MSIFDEIHSVVLSSSSSSSSPSSSVPFDVSIEKATLPALVVAVSPSSIYAILAVDKVIRARHPDREVLYISDSFDGLTKANQQYDVTLPNLTRLNPNLSKNCYNLTRTSPRTCFPKQVLIVSPNDVVHIDETDAVDTWSMDRQSMLQAIIRLINPSLAIVSYPSFSSCLILSLLSSLFLSFLNTCDLIIAFLIKSKPPLQMISGEALDLSSLGQMTRADGRVAVDLLIPALRYRPFLPVAAFGDHLCETYDCWDQLTMKILYIPVAALAFAEILYSSDEIATPLPHLLPRRLLEFRGGLWASRSALGKTKEIGYLYNRCSGGSFMKNSTLGVRDDRPMRTIREEFFKMLQTLVPGTISIGKCSINNDNNSSDFGKNDRFSRTYLQEAVELYKPFKFIIAFENSGTTRLSSIITNPVKQIHPFISFLLFRCRRIYNREDCVTLSSCRNPDLFGSQRRD